jgi:hypothetical protein
MSVPAVADVRPATVRGDLTALRNALDQSIPEKDPHDILLISTWNLKSFGSLTRKWSSRPGDSPRGDLRAILAVGEIVSRFVSSRSR